MIVRAKDAAPTIESTLAAVRAQTVETEVVVVDSGSRDATREIARRWCDRLIEIDPEEFTYGKALNIGARAASAPIHFALSAHCAPARADWVARALRHYRRDDVAAACGDNGLPSGRPLQQVFHQRIEHARQHPFWGFSNHASSWRASVWERFPFDETLDYAEDKEWALRVEAAGWVIAFDPLLWVDMSHRWRSGPRELYDRERRAGEAIGRFAGIPPHRFRDLVREWWAETPPGMPARRARTSVTRAAGMVGRHRGLVRARRLRS